MRAGRVETLAIVALFTGAVAIALSPILVRLSELGPIATAFHRAFLATPALFAVLLLQRPRPAAPRAPISLAAAGGFFAGDLALWHLAVLATSVANATLLANLAPVFVTIGAYLFLGERPRPLFVAGLAVSLVGAAVLASARGLDLAGSGLFGDLLACGTAAFYGGYILMVRRLRMAGDDVLSVMAWSSAVTSALLLPVVLVLGEGLVPATAGGWTTLLALALVSHAFGQGAIAFALAHLPAGFSAVGLLVQPVMAALFAAILLSEPVSVQQALGGLIVLLGIFLARRATA